MKQHLLKLKFAALLLSQFAVLNLKAQTINVSTATELQDAINNATAGQTIQLADGLYERSGGFYVNAGINGTINQPITLRGSKNAILSTGSTTSSYGFNLKGNDYWVLDGFTVYNCKKGVVIDESDHNTIQNLTVNKIGEEGIHLRTFSSYNTVYNCFVDTCGLTSPGTGEGIYIGSASSNWSTYTGGNPDTCNYNIIDYCSFGKGVASENIDIKEGTSYGKVTNCTFDGTGLSGVNSADSWVDLKGNYYTIACNSGDHTMLNGIETHINYAGYGNYNLFYANYCVVPSTGYGIKIQTSGSKGTATDNVVCNTNFANNDALGISNVTEVVCNENCPLVSTEEKKSDDLLIYPNPSNQEIFWNTTGHFSLLSLKGEVIISGYSDRLDLSNLENGIYILNLSGVFHRVVKL